MRIIPLQPIPAQTLQVVLDGQDCTLSFYWRWGRMYADVSVGATPVCKGMLCLHCVKVNINPSISFSGSLYFVDTQAQDAPQWEGLNDRWLLIYLSDGESLDEALGA